jgi:hypothetical protein
MIAWVYGVLMLAALVWFVARLRRIRADLEARDRLTRKRMAAETSTREWSDEARERLARDVYGSEAIEEEVLLEELRKDVEERGAEWFGKEAR